MYPYNYRYDCPAAGDVDHTLPFPEHPFSLPARPQFSTVGHGHELVPVATAAAPVSSALLSRPLLNSTSRAGIGVTVTATDGDGNVSSDLAKVMDLCNAADRHSLAVPEFHLAHVYADLTEGSGAWARRTAQSMVHLAALRRRCLKRLALAQWKDAMATAASMVFYHPIQERQQTQKLPWLTRLELIKLVPRLVKTRCRQVKRTTFMRWQRKTGWWQQNTEPFLSESGRTVLTTRTGGGYRLSYAPWPEDVKDNAVDERAFSSPPPRRPKHHKKPRRYLNQDLEYIPERPMCVWTIQEKSENLRSARFRKTWFIRDGKNAGKETIKAPFPSNPELRLWTGRLPKSELKELIIANSIISARILEQRLN